MDSNSHFVRPRRAHAGPVTTDRPTTKRTKEFTMIHWMEVARAIGDLFSLLAGTVTLVATIWNHAQPRRNRATEK